MELQLTEMYKLSFVDLSKKISASWRACDNRIKLFCARVSDLGMIDYKRAMYYHSKNDKQPIDVEKSSLQPPIFKDPAVKSTSPSLPAPLPQLPSFGALQPLQFPARVVSDDESRSFDNCGPCLASKSLSPLPPELKRAQSSSLVSSLAPSRKTTPSSPIRILDIDDDEIFKIYLAA